MPNMKMLNKGRVFKYVPDTFYTREEFETAANQQFLRLFGRNLYEGEFDALCIWCRKHVEVTDREFGYRLLLGRMGRAKIAGNPLPRYKFLRRDRHNNYKQFTNRDMLVGQMAAVGHARVSTSHMHSVINTLYSLELASSDAREKRMFRSLREAVERGHISSQTAARLISNMVE